MRGPRPYYGGQWNQGGFGPPHPPPFGPHHGPHGMGPGHMMMGPDPFGPPPFATGMMMGPRHPLVNLPLFIHLYSHIFNNSEFIFK